MFDLVNSLASVPMLSVGLSVLGLAFVSLILLGGAVVLVKGVFTPPEQNNNEPRI